MAEIVARFKSYIREDTAPAIGVVGGLLTSDFAGSYVASKLLKDKSDDWKLAGRSVVSLSVGGTFYTLARRFTGLGNILMKSAAVGSVVGVVRDILKEKAGISSEVSERLGASMATQGLSQGGRNFEFKRIKEPYGEAASVGSSISTQLPAGPIKVAAYGE